MALYSDDFVLTLPDALDEAVFAVLRLLMSSPDRSSGDILESRDLVVAIYESNQIAFDNLLKSSTNHNTVFEHLQVLHHEMRASITEKKSNTQQERFSMLVLRRFCYELSDPDVKRIQTLLNELRSLVSEAEEFEEEHRQRVLNKLEALQSELHRRMSSIDKFYGLIGEAGVALGKFGTGAKPFVDRVKEIVEIVWRSQATAEKLPASAKPALLTDHKAGAEDS